MEWQTLAQTNIYSIIYKIVEKLEYSNVKLIQIVIFISTTILLIISIYQYFSTMMGYKKIERSGFEDESKIQFLKQRGKKELRRMQVMIVIWLFLNAILKFI